MTGQNTKKLSNPFSTGGGGAHFEAHIQASFIILMLTGGYAPCFPLTPIKKVKLQGKVDGFDTDDLIVFVGNEAGRVEKKLLAQIKHSIAITRRNPVFSEVIQAAWNDFNNPQLFTNGEDAIALITGPVSKADMHNVQWLLRQARNTVDADEFYRYVDKANFSPAQSAEKLEVFRYHLKNANAGVDISDEALYEFLQSFYLLGYDLGHDDGVILPLLHSHISQLNPKDVHLVWSRVVDFVQTKNQYAGTITLNNLPEDLKEIREKLEKPSVKYMPKDLELTENRELEPVNWNQHKAASHLALANFIGAWNETNPSDKTILEQAIGDDYANWISKARELLQETETPLRLNNGLWQITERLTLFGELGSRIFDQDLDRFKAIATTVLTERDPLFELPASERYLAGIKGKIPPHSRQLRKSVAEGLAILGNHTGLLVNCSPHIAEATALLTLRDIFDNADWILWGSLNDYLPTLAEAAPDEFLSIVEQAFHVSPSPFDELLKQEETSVLGYRNYLTGLFWALEGLAWEEKYLVRVCVILGKLGQKDKRRQSGNSPANSLRTILLPWFPQTLASIDKRKVAVQTLCKEASDVGWNLLLELLPNQHQTSLNTHRPAWRKVIPDDWKEGVSHQEYWEQVSFYAELAVSIAQNDIGKLAELVKYFDHLPKNAFDQLVEILSSEAVLTLTEKERLPIWEHLTVFILRHRQYSSAKWALSDDLLSPLEEAATKLAPAAPLNRHKLLFSSRDIDLYEEKGDWQKQRERLIERRKDAIQEILLHDGLEALLGFAQEVEKPWDVGYALGEIADSNTDNILLPSHLSPNREKLDHFMRGYVWSRHRVNGWTWADELEKSTWEAEQLGIFLAYLPFSGGTWERASDWLGDDEGDFWHITDANPYQSDDPLDTAVDKLLEYERPHAAIDCLHKTYNTTKTISTDLVIRALLAALSYPDQIHSMDAYRIQELIKQLQENSEVSFDELSRIEWNYLPLLEAQGNTIPRTLEKRLATEPEFFCEVIRLIYRSDKEEAKSKEISDAEKSRARNAWHLLHGWRYVPGVQDDGDLDAAQFTNWLERTKEISEETGHLEVTLTQVGHVLIHCPPDPAGLWIHTTVADALNQHDVDPMRSGYSSGAYNARGVHWVDPTGKPELELAEKYHKKAEDVENAGFQRFAVTLRNLAKGYEKESERVRREHETEEEF